MDKGLEKATFGCGCFWCAEAIFQRIRGVKSVISGYAGGSKPNPTYDEVCSGDTRHAEVIQITFDPKEISYDELLDVFWQMHDSTLLNRQGSDVGTQYRSVIFYHDEKQKATATKSEDAIARKLNKLVVTEIKPLTTFYKAEEHHQNYYNNNKTASYCRVVIYPKLRKLKLDA
ncbi:MAG: peptide-methionine (S)-S-oxide reductase MsrA [Candidatus Aenigmarchaeota archaeon]|nr:peptide-methionine (S)-S-oxide reductase MsrA [Candidatus Aenigmarchaeota archaeon]